MGPNPPRACSASRTRTDLLIQNDCSFVRVKKPTVQLSPCRAEAFSGLLSVMSPQIQKDRYFKQSVARLPWICFHEVPNGSGCTFALTPKPRLVTALSYGRARGAGVINTRMDAETELLAAKALWVTTAMAPVLLEGKLVLLELNPQEQKPSQWNAPHSKNLPACLQLLWQRISDMSCWHAHKLKEKPNDIAYVHAEH